MNNPIPGPSPLPQGRAKEIPDEAFDVGRMKALYQQAIFDGHQALADLCAGSLVVEGDLSRDDLVLLRYEARRERVKADYQMACCWGLTLLVTMRGGQLRREFGLSEVDLQELRITPSPVLPQNMGQGERKRK